MKIVFTLCSNNYLAQAKTLGDSLILHNPDYKFIIGLADKKCTTIDYRFFCPHTIIEVESIGIDNINDLIEKYNIVEFNTAVKPFYFEYIFSQYKEAGSVTYIDPDIKIFYSLSHLEELYQTYDFVLTPHLLTPQISPIPPKEQLVLNVGAYNLGFLGLKRSKQTANFIEYFKFRMRDKCYIDLCKGLFVDQIWANQIPSYYEKVHLWKNFGCNVGYWNFSERQLLKDNGNYFVNKNHRLIFFHVSNYNPEMPHILCKWLDYSFDQRKDLKELYDEYRSELLKNKFEIFSRVKPAFEFKRNHPHLNKSFSIWNQIGAMLLGLNNRIIHKIFNI